MDTQVKHTPGPWRLERSEVRRHLCVMGGSAFDTWICGEMQSDNDTRIDTSECVANAHLIAAAPDMLKALTQLVECLDLALEHDDVPLPFAGHGALFITDARDAISKAIGETWQPKKAA